MSSGRGARIDVLLREGSPIGTNRKSVSIMSRACCSHSVINENVNENECLGLSVTMVAWRLR